LLLQFGRGSNRISNGRSAATDQNTLKIEHDSARSSRNYKIIRIEGIVEKIAMNLWQTVQNQEVH